MREMLAPRRQGLTDARGELTERYFVATQWQLMWRKFGRHRLALVGAAVLAVFYLGALFAEFLAPSVPSERYAKMAFAPPQRVRLLHQGRLRGPFVYGYQRTTDPVTLQKNYLADEAQLVPIRLFVRGPEYRLWGLFAGDRHLFGSADGAPVMLLGADSFGRDLLTRNIYAARVSLSVGLAAVLVSFVLGVILGGISGYFGGTVDLAIQRFIEFLMSLPTIPVWMGLSAALPLDWSSIKVYFVVTLILSIIGWTGLARVVRGKILSLREEDYATAALLAGASKGRVMARHLLPGFTSHIIVSLTLTLPNMILGETSLSFLGLGLRPPITSWGVLLKEAQNVQAVALQPWLLTPAFFVIVAVLAFNFVGDGMRDAADPYSR